MNEPQELVRRQHQSYVVRWEMIFDMLSMERVEPFLAEMGLQVSNVEAIRSIARRFVQQVEPLGDDAESEIRVVQQTISQVAAATDEQTAQNLHRWGMEVFPYGPQRGFFHWKLLLLWLAGLAAQHYPVTPPALDKDKAEMIVRVVREKFGDALVLDQRMEEAEQLPRSSWEERIYQSSEVGYSPLMSVDATISHHRFMQVWEKIETLLTREEMEILLQWAKTHAPRLQINPDSIELPL